MRAFAERAPSLTFAPVTALAPRSLTWTWPFLICGEPTVFLPRAYAAPPVPAIARTTAVAAAMLAKERRLRVLVVVFMGVAFRGRRELFPTAHEPRRPRRAVHPRPPRTLRIPGTDLRASPAADLLD